MRFEVKWSHASYKFRISLCNHLTDHLTVKWFKCTLFLLFRSFSIFSCFSSVFERMSFYGFETKSCVLMGDDEFLIMSIKIIATNFINVASIFSVTWFYYLFLFFFNYLICRGYYLTFKHDFFSFSAKKCSWYFVFFFSCK